MFGIICVEGIAAAAAALATRELFGALHGNGALPILWMWVLPASGLVIAGARVVARTRGERIGQEYVLEIRRSLFSQAASMNAHDVAARRVGYMSLRFVGDLAAFRDWLALGLPRLMAATVFIPVTLGVLGYMHQPFLTVALPLYGVMLLLIAVGGLRLPKLHRRLRSRRAAIAADLAERLPIAPQLGQLGRRTTELRLISRHSQRMIVASQARVRYAQSLKVVPDVFAGLVALGLIWTGAHTGAATSTIAAGLAALGICSSPLRDLANVWNLWSAFRVARDKCARALNRPSRRERSGGLSLPSGPIAVDLQGVSAGDSSDFSAAIPAGAPGRENHASCRF